MLLLLLRCGRQRTRIRSSPACLSRDLVPPEGWTPPTGRPPAPSTATTYLMPPRGQRRGGPHTCVSGRGLSSRTPLTHAGGYVDLVAALSESSPQQQQWLHTLHGPHAGAASCWSRGAAHCGASSRTAGERHERRSAPLAGTSSWLHPPRGSCRLATAAGWTWTERPPNPRSHPRMCEERRCKHLRFKRCMCDPYSTHSTPAQSRPQPYSLTSRWTRITCVRAVDSCGGRERGGTG